MLTGKSASPLGRYLASIMATMLFFGCASGYGTRNLRDPAPIHSPYRQFISRLQIDGDPVRYYVKGREGTGFRACGDNEKHGRVCVTFYPIGQSLVTEIDKSSHIPPDDFATSSDGSGTKTFTFSGNKTSAKNFTLVIMDGGGRPIDGDPEDVVCQVDSWSVVSGGDRTFSLQRPHGEHLIPVEGYGDDNTWVGERVRVEYRDSLFGTDFEQFR